LIKIPPSLSNISFSGSDANSASRCSPYSDEMNKMKRFVLITLAVSVAVDQLVLWILWD
jgi:hypothetical protein